MFGQISAVITVSILSITIVIQPSMNVSVVHASRTPYDLGYDHGCEDVGLTESERYRLEGHTDEFVRGYYDGYTACGGTISPSDRELESLGEEPGVGGTQAGGIDWIKLCDDLQPALVSSCNALVNSDNTLTVEGERAVGCIRNGILLAGGGTLLVSLPPPLVIAALQILEEPTGCGGIVEWGLIGNVNDLQSVINRLT